MLTLVIRYIIVHTAAEYFKGQIVLLEIIVGQWAYQVSLLCGEFSSFKLLALCFSGPPAASHLCTGHITTPF